MRYLVLDITNMLHRTFYANTNEDDKTLAGLASHSALVTINKYFRMFRPDKIVMAFDRHSWRKDYTSSDECLSKKPYKGNRRQSMTPSQQLKYQRFLNHLAEFESLISKCTTIKTLVNDGLEADDLIAGFCQIYSDDDNEIIIISTDSDMAQLLRYTNVRVISPATDKDQSLQEYDDDPLFYLFQKCMRGDPTDNVQSAFPRCRAAKIKQAYTDEFARTNLMNSTWTFDDGNGEQVYRVGDLFKENQLLIDLEKQPNNIRELIFNTIEDEMNKSKQFAMFNMLKFIGKYDLVKIKEGMDQYILMLSK